MFTDACLTSLSNGTSGRDDDGAKRMFFGGERFLEGISGEAYVIQSSLQCLSLDALRADVLICFVLPSNLLP